MKISDVKSRLNSLVNQVYRKETRVLVEKSGIPVAALVSAEDLARLARLDAEREERRQLLARMREPFRDVPPEQVERDVAALVAEVRAEDEQATVERRPA
jgi:prevent-host-death family protein